MKISTVNTEPSPSISESFETGRFFQQRMLKPNKTQQKRRNSNATNPKMPQNNYIVTIKYQIYQLKALLSAMWWAWCASVAWASPSASSFAGWLDMEDSATVATVQRQADWEAFTGWKGWAYGPEPVWLRIQVPATDASNAPPWVLIVRPPYLDRVTFFDPAFGGERRAGDFFPATEDALGSVLFTFEVPAQTTVRDVFVKVQSASARVVHLSLLPLPEAQAYTRSVEWVTGFVLVLSLVFFVWAFVQWLLTREQLMGIFAIKQGVVVLWGFLMLGFGRLVLGPWLGEGVQSLISSMVVAGVVASSIWFLAALLEDFQARRWMLGTIRVLAGFIASLAVWNLFGYTQQSLQIINTLAPPLLMWVVLTLWFAPGSAHKPPISKPALLAYLSMYGLLNSLPALTHVGLLQESFILFIGNMSLLVLDGLIMLAILSVRQRRFKEQHQAVATQLMLQQEQARLVQQYLNDQRQLLAMLAHEMKTPLANLRIWMEAGPQGRPVMERAIVDMDRVIDRCVHAGQLSDQSLKPRHEWLDAAELTQSVLATSRQPQRVQLALPPDICAVHTDAQMLSIVLSNVLENAYKYSPPESAIGVALTPLAQAGRPPGWCWTVDNVVGEAGFPDADKVFNKYYRSAGAQRQSGSGLGLFLVKSLLELMGGQVTYAATGHGVQFKVWVPADGLSPSVGD